MEKIHLYCDGACKNNPGKGGWGALHMNSATHKPFWTLCGGSVYTTNNIMELTAAIKALEMVPPFSHVTLYSDSEYVLLGLVDKGTGPVNPYDFTGRLGWWLSHNWTKKSKPYDPVANRELWEELIFQCQRVVQLGGTLDVAWVKGHSKDVGNKLADILAKKGIPS